MMKIFPQSMTFLLLELINDKDVCRKTPATPGLLIIHLKNGMSVTSKKKKNIVVNIVTLCRVAAVNLLKWSFTSQHFKAIASLTQLKWSAAGN